MSPPPPPPPPISTKQRTAICEFRTYIRTRWGIIHPEKSLPYEAIRPTETSGLTRRG